MTGTNNKKLALLFCGLLLIFDTEAQQKNQDNDDPYFSRYYRFTQSHSEIRDRLFYWTTLVENDKKVMLAMEKDSVLVALLKESRRSFNSVVHEAGVTASQISSTLSFSEAQISTVPEQVEFLASDDVFTAMTENHIRPCGLFNRFTSMRQGTLHRYIVEEMLQGINQIISTYGAGNAPKYPKLDSIRYDASSPTYRAQVRKLAAKIARRNYSLFYEPQLHFALGLLALNHRDEAGQFSPLLEGENKKAYNHVQSINWNSFSYSMIVVPGDSPNEPGDLPNISLGGMARVDHAVSLYKQGLAPVLVMSGANVAPFQSAYFEALEMKKYAMTKHGVATEHIIIEPHSRHTTTNMRNAGRLWYRFGFPADKKGIISTAESQSTYIESDKFSARCLEEMGHQPIILYKRLSINDLEFLPRIQVLHHDSRDPLDP